MKANEHPDYLTLTIISVLLPIVGIILGIVYLTRPDTVDRKLGEHLIAFSLAVIILAAFAGFALVTLPVLTAGI